MPSESGKSLKEKGNALFKSGDYQQAVDIYTSALDVALEDREVLLAVLSNRAACFLKLERYQDCIDDCSAALEINGSQPKPYYRRATAHESTGDLQSAFKDLSKLIQIDPKNVEGIKAMRRVKAALEKERAQDTEVNRILTAISNDKKVEDGLRALIGICVDDASHAMDFIRKGGLTKVGRIIEADLCKVNGNCDLATLGLRLFGAACTHQRFVSDAVVIIENSDDISSLEALSSHTLAPPLLVEIAHEDSGNSRDHLPSTRINWVAICHLMAHPNGHIAQACSSLAMRCLKAWPAGILLPPAPVAPPIPPSQHEEDIPRVEELADDDDGSLKPEAQAPSPPSNTSSTPMKEYDLFLKKSAAVTALRGWLRALNNEDLEAFSLTADALSAFFSETEDYIGHEKIVDARMEGLQERKDRMSKVRLLKKRSKMHAKWAVEEGALELLLQQMDAGRNTISGALTARRQRAGACFGRLACALDDDDLLKRHLEPFLVGKDTPSLRPGDPLPSMDKCRLRAVMEGSLFLSKPEIGSWALGEGGGIQQLLLLTSSGDDRCQEIAAEVMCLAATCESGSAQLSPIVSSGALQTLMRSPLPTTRAAAASALTKLSLQAKALKEDSPETSEMLNVVLGVLKSSAATTGENKTNKPSSKSAEKKKDASAQHLVSFSAVGDAFDKKDKKPAPGELKDGKDDLSSKALSSTERAIEVLAAMVGKTFVKEEMVHGSYRVAASLESILQIDLDPSTTTRSTAPYGVAHIMAALTVTNRELRAKALAEKDISVEQYEQLQELQRVKAKDNEGNDIEEKKEEDDPDTEMLCRNRIKRIAAANGISALIKLMSHDSKQTKEYACRALRQMCVEESIRGQVVQQGGLKACIAVVNDEEVERTTRREAAHAIAKTLVTTNPHILSEHLRLGVMHPLIFLCREVDSTNLQQFEALLTLTNLTSCGPSEQDRFVADKGVPAVHYLMFSDHYMVRRAATEVLCNMGNHEAILKLLRVPDKVRLWLGFCEDWDNADNEEAFATARAAAGTLAYACGDADVGKALLAENCATSILSLLESENSELAHRAIVIINELCELAEVELAAQIATHLVEGGVVPSLAVMMQLDASSGDGQGGVIGELAKNAAMALSNAISNGKK